MEWPVIQTRDLRRTFKTRSASVEAVAGVDLQVESGEVFGFLGPNGAGKTTTLRMLSTLLPPTSGHAEVVGCDLVREPQGRARLWNEVRRLKAGGMTVFLTTHYLEEADALCDRLAIIDHGRIVVEATPEKLKHDIAGDVISLGVADDEQRALAILQSEPYVRKASIEGGALRLYVDRGESAMPAVLRLLDASGFDLQTIALSRPSLDDVFLQQTGHSLRESEADLAA